MLGLRRAAAIRGAAELLEELLDFRGKIVHLALAGRSALALAFGVFSGDLDLDRHDRGFDTIDQRRERRRILGQVGGGDGRSVSGVSRAERVAAEDASDAECGDRDRGKDRVASPLWRCKTGE